MTDLVRIIAEMREVESHSEGYFSNGELEEKIAEWRDRLAALAGAAPDTVRVPREPTWEMIEEGAKGMASFQDGSRWPESWHSDQIRRMRNDAAKAYRYMIDATPHAPAKAREVTDAEVERACRAYWASDTFPVGHDPSTETRHVQRMRAALATFAEGARR